MVSTRLDAFPGGETDSEYRARMESWLAAQQCLERESGGFQCEKSAAHVDPCACPKALRMWMSARYGRIVNTENAQSVTPRI
jgi:hypothetical protein